MLNLFILNIIIEWEGIQFDLIWIKQVLCKWIEANYFENVLLNVGNLIWVNKLILELGIW